jgi:hypothetical protein
MAEKELVGSPMGRFNPLCLIVIITCAIDAIDSATKPKTTVKPVNPMDAIAATYDINACECRYY